MGGSDREESPDWLRSFQVPSRFPTILSSESNSPVNSDDEDEVSLNKLFPKESSLVKEEPTTGRKRRRTKDTEKEVKAVKKERKTAQKPAKEERSSEEPFVSSEHNHSVWAPSSDSDDSLQEIKPVVKEDIHDDGESLPKEASALKAPKKKLQKGSNKPVKAEENAEEDGRNAEDVDHEEKTTVKRSGLHVSSTRLPLMLTEKVQRTKALVECEGDSIDLSGDVGAVGRVVISEDSSGHHDMLLDLKGTVYQTNILPCRTFCVVSFAQSEAKIETIMNDFIQLKAPTDVFGAETMVEGTLDGFSFDSEEEMDHIPKSNAANQGDGEGDNEQQKGKPKKKAGKAAGAGQKKTKAAGGKKVKKKTQATKKGKAKK